MAFGTPGRRVAIIAGVRTPFAKAGTALKDLSAIELGKRCVAELIQRTELDGTQVDRREIFEHRPGLRERRAHAGNDGDTPSGGSKRHDISLDW